MIKPEKTKTLQVRVSDDDLTLFKIAAYSIGQTPSQLVRMFIDTTTNALKLKIQKGEINLEDYKKLFNDKL